MHAVHYIKIIFNLLEKFSDIINHNHILIIGANFHSFSMNDVCTMSLTDIVGHPAKVIQLIAFFLNSKCLFVWLLCQPSASQLGMSAHDAHLQYNIHDK